MSVEKYEKDEQIKKVRPMNTGREGERGGTSCEEENKDRHYSFRNYYIVHFIKIICDRRAS